MLRQEMLLKVPRNQTTKSDPVPEGGATLAGTPVPALLQTAPLCAHLGINSSTIWRWIREHDFPKPVSIGAKVRMWRTVEVDNWLNKQAATAQATRQAAYGAHHE